MLVFWQSVLQLSCKSFLFASKWNYAFFIGSELFLGCWGGRRELALQNALICSQLVTFIDFIMQDTVDSLQLSLKFIHQSNIVLPFLTLQHEFLFLFRWNSQLPLQITNHSRLLLYAALQSCKFLLQTDPTVSLCLEIIAFPSRSFQILTPLPQHFIQTVVLLR